MMIYMVLYKYRIVYFSPVEIVETLHATSLQGLPDMILKICELQPQVGFVYD